MVFFLIFSVGDVWQMSSTQTKLNACLSSLPQQLLLTCSRDSCHQLQVTPVSTSSMRWRTRGRRSSTTTSPHSRCKWACARTWPEGCRPGSSSWVFRTQPPGVCAFADSSVRAQAFLGTLIDAWWVGDGKEGKQAAPSLHSH